jgi:hypothetical protein
MRRFTRFAGGGEVGGQGAIGETAQGKGVGEIVVR